MPLYEFPNLNTYDPVNIEEWDIIKKPKKILNKSSWEKMVRTVDEV